MATNIFCCCNSGSDGNLNSWGPVSSFGNHCPKQWEIYDIAKKLRCDEHVYTRSPSLQERVCFNDGTYIALKDMDLQYFLSMMRTLMIIIIKIIQ